MIAGDGICFEGNVINSGEGLLIYGEVVGIDALVPLCYHVSF